MNNTAPSHNALKMNYDAPSAQPRAVSGPSQGPSGTAPGKTSADKWREMYAERSIERDQISPGTRFLR